MGRYSALLLALFALTACNRTHTTSASAEAAGGQPRELPNGTVSVTGPILSYANVVQHVAPAVVTIRSSRRVRAPQQFPFSDDPFFRQFFGGGVPRGGGRTEVEQALGSGVIVRADGNILTNHHVIDGAQDIRVDLTDGRTFSAKVVGSDAASDLAVLKIGASGLPVLQLGDSDKVRVGDVCLAVGNPLAVGQTVTEGIISAKGRSTETGDGSFQDFLQTDAPINQGNSGGALVNTRAELIGINSQILSNNGGFIGIGFAIPSNMAKNVMNQLIAHGKVERGMLGVTIQQLTPDLAKSFGLSQAHGVLISSVTPGGPAERAGLKAGDIVSKMNGSDISDTNDFRNRVAADPPGTDITLTVIRNGNTQEFHVKLGELTAQAAAGQGGGPGGQGGGGGKLGITVAPVTPQSAQQFGLPRGTQGVVIESVDPNGPAAQAGLQPGDVIEQVNRQNVRTPQDVQSALQRGNGGTALLLIQRGNQTIFLTVPMGQ